MSNLITRLRANDLLPADMEFLVEEAADEIERLKGLLDKFVYLEDNPNYIDPLQARVEALEGVYKAAVNYAKFQSHVYAGLLFDAVRAATEQD